MAAYVTSTNCELLAHEPDLRARSALELTLRRWTDKSERIERACKKALEKITALEKK